MSKKVIIRDKVTGECISPVTNTDSVFDNGNSIKDKYATKDYADEAAADILNSSPEQLDIINLLAEKLADDENLANAVTRTIADAKKELFIDLWCNARPECASNIGYNRETDKFWIDFPFGNGVRFTVDDIDYKEAITILMRSNVSANVHCPYQSRMRINLPPYQYFNPQSMGIIAHYNNDLEYIILANSNNNICAGANIGDSCTKLKGILGTIYIVNNVSRINAPQLRWFRHQFNGSNATFNIKDSALVEYISLFYIVDLTKEGFSNNKVIVHPNVYAALTGEAEYPFNGGTQEEWQQLLADAIAKNITFTTV